MNDVAFTGRHVGLLEQGFLETDWLMEEIRELKEKSRRELLVSMRGLLRGHKTLQSLIDPLIVDEPTHTEISAHLLCEIGTALKHAKFTRADVDQLVSNPYALEVLLNCLREQDFMMDGNARFVQKPKLHTKVIEELLHQAGTSREIYSICYYTAPADEIPWNRHRCTAQQIPRQNNNEHNDRYTDRLHAFLKDRNTLSATVLSFFLKHPYYIPPIGEFESIAFPRPLLRYGKSRYGREHSLVLHPPSKKISVRPFDELYKANACVLEYAID